MPITRAGAVQLKLDPCALVACALLLRFRLLHIIGTTLVVVSLICFALLRVMLSPPLDVQTPFCVFAKALILVYHQVAVQDPSYALFPG